MATGVALAAGAAVGVLIPRGPITTEQALITIVVGTATGVAAALVRRSRWSMLAPPFAFVIAFELVRRAFVSGPSIDSFRLDMLYGVLAFVLGRIVLVVAGALPMMLGACIVLAGRRPSPCCRCWC